MARREERVFMIFCFTWDRGKKSKRDPIQGPAGRGGRQAAAPGCWRGAQHPQDDAELRGNIKKKKISFKNIEI